MQHTTHLSPISRTSTRPLAELAGKTVALFFAETPSSKDGGGDGGGGNMAFSISSMINEASELDTDAAAVTSVTRVGKRLIVVVETLPPPTATYTVGYSITVFATRNIDVCGCVRARERDRERGSR